MDKYEAIKRIEEAKEDMINSLKMFNGDALIPLFEEYTKDIIEIVEKAVM